jgi:flagellar biosynthetic protein FliQ
MMDNCDMLDLARRAITLVLVAGAPVLATALIVGVIVSLVQAVTQVQDQTLTFVPKIIAVLVALAIVGPWMMEKLIEFGREMFGTLP